MLVAITSTGEHARYEGQPVLGQSDFYRCHGDAGAGRHVEGADSRGGFDKFLLLCDLFGGPWYAQAKLYFNKDPVNRFNISYHSYASFMSPVL